ncbi:SPFH domain-containing protein [Rhodospira trueperi]|uniref:SPFH domain / Band 7 family protein n=1 Tax=Rhodospira trueperi TaxID=69960 RepID=A0A1G7DJH6_9PROT|nr:SPFH domain-containing protein [Rhodospira trueperi]SDE51691.1 SPFH domain / Band 7 family protein [Rhodospira trueperi]
MAQIKRYPFVRHLRAEAASSIQLFRKGRRVRSGRGLAFWFLPDGASIVEVPLDDRPMPFVIKGQSADFQEVTVQGTVVWRVSDPQRLGDRVDFTIDLKKGLCIGQPLDQIHTVLLGLVRQFTFAYLRDHGVTALLKAGAAPLQDLLNASLAGQQTLAKMGLEHVGTSLAGLMPTSELARALQAPTFESLQQQADEASFARRALAVEKERAIAENELNNQIELAARQKDLIARETANDRSRVEAEAANRTIEAEAEAAMSTIRADAEGRAVRTVDLAKAEAERARMEVYAQVTPAVLLALAAQEFAAKVRRIDSLTITPDVLSDALARFGGLIGRPQAQAGGDR